jgi:hypothetical protein
MGWESIISLIGSLFGGGKQQPVQPASTGAIAPMQQQDPNKITGFLKAFGSQSGNTPPAAPAGSGGGNGYAKVPQL